MSLRFVLLGNVDNGKSTLAGRMLIESGYIDDNEIRKARQGLLKKGKTLFERICDFNQIVERN